MNKKIVLGMVIISATAGTIGWLLRDIYGKVKTRKMNRKQKEDFDKILKMYDEIHERLIKQKEKM